MLYTNIPGKEDYQDDNTPQINCKISYSDYLKIIKLDALVADFHIIFENKRKSSTFNDTFWNDENKVAFWFFQKHQITRAQLEMYVSKKYDITEVDKILITNLIGAYLEREQWEEGREERRIQGIIKAEAKRKIARELKKEAYLRYIQGID